MEITKEYLKSIGFKEDKEPVTGKLEFIADFKNSSNADVHVTIRYGVSNMNGRDWFCHIDNAHFETIATADIQTSEHLNDLLKLIDVKLN